jgi:hypothetical protein
MQSRVLLHSESTNAPPPSSPRPAAAEMSLVRDHLTVRHASCVCCQTCVFGSYDPHLPLQEAGMGGGWGALSERAGAAMAVGPWRSSQGHTGCPQARTILVAVLHDKLVVIIIQQPKGVATVVWVVLL